MAQLVAMTGWYHTERGLDVGHTLPIGEPWMSNWSLNYFLVSLPYLFGPDLGHAARMLWLIPITESEKLFRHEHGLVPDALEQRLEDASLRYYDPHRASVV